MDFIEPPKELLNTKPSKKRNKSKQRGEGIMKNYLKKYGLWYLKLQVLPMSHTKTPADFIVLGQRRYLIECKDVNLDTNASRSFPFSRLTQDLDLLAFHNNSEHNKALVYIIWWLGSQKESHEFLIPIELWNYRLKDFSKKSMNIKDCEKIFYDCNLNHTTFNIRVW